MTFSEPLDAATYDLEEALELLTALEDAREALADSDHLAVVAVIEHEVARLDRKLGFDRPFGGADGR
jgi:hypothetical protein